MQLTLVAFKSVTKASHHQMLRRSITTSKGISNSKGILLHFCGDSNMHECFSSFTWLLLRSLRHGSKYEHLDIVYTIVRLLHKTKLQTAQCNVIRK